MAHRPGAIRRRRVDRRHRHARLQPRLLRLGAGCRDPRGRPHELRRRPPRRRQRACHAALPSGARGMIWASQVAPGNENRLTLRVYGTKAGLEWSQEEPNYLWFAVLGAEAADHPRRRRRRRGRGRVTRVPPATPKATSKASPPSMPKRRAPSLPRVTVNARSRGPLPTVEDGVKGVAFVEACVKSSGRNGAWVTLLVDFRV